MKNLEKITQIDNVAEILYMTNIYDHEICFPQTSPLCPEENIQKHDCLDCIKEWLNQEASDTPLKIKM